MDDKRQELIQRSLDGELDEAAQKRLDELCEQDPDMAGALEQHQELQQDLQALAVDPGPKLTDQIMEALPREPDPPPIITRLTRLLRSLQRPVAVPAWQMGLLALGVGALLLYTVNQDTREPPRAPAAVAKNTAPPTCPAPPANEPPRSACPATPRLMTRFLLHAPKARQVALVGDFNDWAREGTPLSDPDENGVWTVSVPLSPGRYQYKFLVNGEQWVVEPDAPAYHPDGFGGRNSLLEI